MLSYAGLRDPGTAAPGPIWGGVISTTGGAASTSAAATPASTSPAAAANSPAAMSSPTSCSRATPEPPSESTPGLAPAAFTRLRPLRHALPVQRSRPQLRTGRILQPWLLFPRRRPGYLRMVTTEPTSITSSPRGLGVQTFEQEEAPFYPLDPTLQSAFVPSNAIPCTAGQAPSYNCGEYPLQNSTPSPTPSTPKLPTALPTTGTAAASSRPAIPTTTTTSPPASSSASSSTDSTPPKATLPASSASRSPPPPDSVEPNSQPPGGQALPLQIVIRRDGHALRCCILRALLSRAVCYRLQIGRIGRTNTLRAKHPYSGA